MSFLSDLFEGHTSNLGNDLSHAATSLEKHPSELYETLGGAAALATGGLALGGLGALGADAGAAGGGLTGLFGGAADTGVVGGADSAALDASVAGLTPDLPPAVDAASVGGTSNAYVGNLFGLDSSVTGASPNVLASTVSPDITGATGGGATGGGSFFDSSAASAAYGGGGTPPNPFNISNPSTYLPGITQGISQNPLKALGVLGGAGALGYDILEGRKPLADQNALQGQATQLSAQGQQFMSYLQAGTLPPGLQTLVDKQTQAAKAMAIANAAKNGQSTDPTTNTQLADAINSAQQQATMQVAQLGEQLFQQGMNETQVSAQIMQYLTNLDEQQTQNMGKAIASFAASLAGGGGTTLKLAP